MKTTLSATRSIKKISKKLFLFGVLLFVAIAAFAQAPTISSFSPTSGAVGTLVIINGANLGTPTAFSIGGVTALVVNNTGTVLTGYVMPGAITGAISLATSGGTATTSGNFTVTATKFPGAQQGGKLVGTGNTGAALQGVSAAVSADGNTAVVGGSGDNGGQGAVWVYTRTGATWTQQGSKLVGTGGIGTPGQGSSVAISADGNTVIESGYNDNAQQGATWVFARTNGVWSQQGGKLVGSDGIGSPEQGCSVSLSADGNTAIVGGVADNDSQGAAWVYARSGGVWSQQGSKLVGTGGVGVPELGISVCLSADGNTAMVGGYVDNASQGAAWVFTRSNGTWAQQGSKLVGTGSTGDGWQGWSVSLSADGNTAIVGAVHDNNGEGAAWVYTRNGGVWSQQGGKLLGSGNTGAAQQGQSVSLSADGNTAILGGFVDNTTGNTAVGAIWVFTRSSGTWSQQGNKLLGADNTGPAEVGYAVSLSADGNTAIAGGPHDNSNQGAAWMFTVGAPTISSFSPASGPVGTLVTINGTNLGTPTAFSIGGVTALVVNNSGTVLTGFVMPGAITGAVSLTTSGGTATASGNFTVTATKFPNVQQGSKLVGTGNVGSTWQGFSVAVSADGNTAILGGYMDNSNQGAAWIYTRSGGGWSQQGSKLVGIGNTGAAQQGWSVSLSADGNTAIVGGTGDNAGQGAAWVYTRNGGTWSQQGGKLVGSGNISQGQQGFSVSLSADGNTAVVGAPEDNAEQGAAWVYTRNGGTWSQQGSKLVGTGNSGQAGQGNSVAISADANTVIVGGDSDGGNDGAAWVFTRNVNTWSQQGSKLVGTGSVGQASEGCSVSLSADGNTAIVGGFSDGGGGAAWIYTRSGGNWSQQGNKLVGTGGTSPGAQGWSVSISADGNTAIVGAPGASAGGMWVYTRSGVTWSQQGSELTGTGSIGVTSLGQSVSLSANGSTAIMGGPEDNTNQGAAWVFIAGSSNALLSTIALNPASTLTNAGTSGTITTYTTTANAGTTSVTVTPTAQDANATIKVNGIAVTSGTASGTIALAVGKTTITTVVTAQDGTTTHTYSITVTRAAPSSNASLSTIALTPYSTLTNTGTTGTTTTYTTSVAYLTTSIKVTPATQDPTATVKVNGTTVASGTASASIPLSVGANIITTVVTAQDGTTTHTYSITVTRAAPSSNASLSTIVLSPYSSLTNAGTVGTTTTYTTTVSNATTSVKVTPTTGDPNATVKVNGITVASGTASGAIALGAEGTTTTINTVVTAQDGTTTKTYSIVVTRAPSSNASLTTIALTPYSTLTNTGTTGATTTYTTSVSNATTSVKVTPTTSDANAKVKVNGVAVTSGTASGSIALAVGQTTITTVVTAQDGTTTKTYSITVTRATGPLHSLYLPISVVQPADNLNIENDGVMVHQGVSPNGDGINDFLTIDGIIAYPDNSLQIIDRNGTLIYQAKGYNNITKVFDGHSGINGRMQQPGTYFYSLDYVADGQNRHKTGYILLKY